MSKKGIIRTFRYNNDNYSLNNVKLCSNNIFRKIIITFAVMKVRINRITWNISLALLICGHIIASDIRITEILISGNKITKDFIILRELPFGVGDTLSEDKLIELIEVATENLNNTSLFNYVYLFSLYLL